MLDPFRNDLQQCYKKKLILKTLVLRVRTSCSKAFISCLTNVAHVFEHIIQGNFTKYICSLTRLLNFQWQQTSKFNNSSPIDPNSRNHHSAPWLILIEGFPMVQTVHYQFSVTKILKNQFVLYCRTKQYEITSIAPLLIEGFRTVPRTHLGPWWFGRSKCDKTNKLPFLIYCHSPFFLRIYCKCFWNLRNHQIQVLPWKRWGLHLPNLFILGGNPSQE
jgi:hypothetical protein